MSKNYMNRRISLSKTWSQRLSWMYPCVLPSNKASISCLAIFHSFHSLGFLTLQKRQIHCETTASMSEWDRRLHVMTWMTHKQCNAICLHLPNGERNVTVLEQMCPCGAAYYLGNWHNIWIQQSEWEKGNVIVLRCSVVQVASMFP